MDDPHIYPSSRIVVKKKKRSSSPKTTWYKRAKNVEVAGLDMDLVDLNDEQQHAVDSIVHGCKVSLRAT